MVTRPVTTVSPATDAWAVTLPPPPFQPALLLPPLLMLPDSVCRRRWLRAAQLANTAQATSGLPPRPGQLLVDKTKTEKN